MSHNVTAIKPTTRIGIDARLIYQTGVGVYIRNLIFNLAQTPVKDFEFHIYVRRQDMATLKDQLPNQKHNRSLVFHGTQVAWHSVAEQFVFLLQLLKDRIDLMHFPYFSWPILYVRPFVATVHDTILLTQATGKATTRSPLVYWIKHFVFRLVLSQQVKRAISIIVPSHAVAHELANFYPQAQRKIEVIYEGVDKEFEQADLVPNAQLQGTSYFLYVGNCYPHKNINILLHAFEQVVKHHVDTHLCLVGPQNAFSENIRSWVHRHTLQRSILLLHNVRAGELKWLYANAKALVFPSKTEGFGLPIVEAALSGCPMILTDIPVFHEVIGNQAQYFQPHDTEKLQNLMRIALREDERKHYDINSQYSFTTMTQKIVQIYERVSQRR